MMEFEKITQQEHEPETQPEQSLSDFFSEIEKTQNEAEPQTETEAKQEPEPEHGKQNPEFAAKVIYGIIKAVLNGVCVWRTGATFEANGIDIDREKSDFIEILSDGFKTGAIKQPSPAFIAVVFLLSFFSEPVYFLVTYKGEKNPQYIQEEKKQPEAKEIKRKRKPHKEGCRCVVCKQKHK